MYDMEIGSSLNAESILPQKKIVNATQCQKLIQNKQ